MNRGPVARLRPGVAAGGGDVGVISLQRILLADDEPDILEIARIALETVGGYEVAVCESGADFLRLLPELQTRSRDHRCADAGYERAPGA